MPKIRAILSPTEAKRRHELFKKIYPALHGTLEKTPERMEFYNTIAEACLKSMKKPGSMKETTAKESENIVRTFVRWFGQEARKGTEFEAELPLSNDEINAIAKSVLRCMESHKQ
ncbi:MAG: hypothetical protein V1676_02865 [Candidatus Diapherotrites archaeon]